jgi:hypothetical protein
MSIPTGGMETSGMLLLATRTEYIIPHTHNTTHHTPIQNCKKSLDLRRLVGVASSGPFFGLSPQLFSATALQDADNLRTKMLALEYPRDGCGRLEQ